MYQAETQATTASVPNTAAPTAQRRETRATGGATTGAVVDIGGGNRNRAFLRDDRWLVLSMFKGKDATYPGTFHIGFGQPSEAKVDEINARLKADGFDIHPPEHTHAYTFYVKAPGGFTVEVMH